MAGVPAPAALFHFAILGATWFAGWRAGLLSVALSFVLALTSVLPLTLSSDPSAGPVWPAVIFLLSALAVYAAMLLVREAMSRAAESTRKAGELTELLRRSTQELERAAALSRRLQEITAALVRAMTPPQVVRAILDDGVPLAGADHGLLALIEDGSQQVFHTTGFPGSLAEAVRSGRLGSDEQPSEPTWIENGPLFAGLGPEANMSWALLPARIGERRLGTLVLGFEDGRAFSDDERGFMLLLVQECAKALERARLYAAERGARVMAQFAERQVGFLAAASAKLAATLEPSRSLADVADLTVANLGDFCAIHLQQPNEPARLVAGSIATGAGLIRFGADEDRYPVHPDSPVGFPAVLRSGRGELLPSIDASVRERAGITPDRIERLAELNLTTQVCVPLRARSEILGAITIGSTQTGRRFSYAELVMAEELASRVAQSLDNAMLYQNALQASRAKSSFLAVMSHELRTPLNAILGYSDLILLGVPAEIGPETRHQVERIRRAAHNLLQIVEDVLNFARVEAGKETVRIGVIALAQLVGEAVELIRPLADDKGLELTCQADTDVVLHTDAGKVGQILNNLLSNAVKFTDSGSIDVVAGRDGANAFVSVSDTGIGIPAEHQEHIFDPFWQVEQTPTRRYGGTGIGLGVARNLARLLGGDLSVSSGAQQGSAFRLTLPLRYESIAPEVRA